VVLDKYALGCIPSGSSRTRTVRLNRPMLGSRHFALRHGVGSPRSPLSGSLATSVGYSRSVRNLPSSSIHGRLYLV
jgi:hypothetical protein